ncbi:MAG: branched-chain amino acid ABC transporter permease [Pseudomonadota bacterium]|nr:MAG: branched-chain amino acid ABC transporter permease [Pseudomonadota bacterium]
MENSIDLLNALVLISNYVLIPSLSYGSQLALGAVGVTLVFGILRFANFAHGELMGLGCTATIFFTWWFQSMGISHSFFPTALFAMPFAMLITILLVLAIDRSVFRFYRLNKSQPVTFVVASVGVMFMLNGLVRMLIGTDEIIFRDGQKFLIKAGLFKKMTGLNEGLALKQTQVLTVALAVVCSVSAFRVFLQRTRTGKAMRAYSDNEDLALLSGISTERIVMVTWIIAASLATLPGVLYGLDKSFKPIVYFHLLLPIFASAIVGGNLAIHLAQF